jgi:hypothetical protein
VESKTLIHHLCIAFGLVAIFISQATAVTITIEPAKDTTLYAEPDLTLGNSLGDYLFAGTTLQAVPRRSLLAFDIVGSIPAGAVITSVELKLTHSRNQSASGFAASLHRVTKLWGEGTSNAPGQEGGGINAEAGDATWQETVLGGVDWDSPGGDFVELTSTAQVVAGLGDYVWPSTPGAIADVQSWLDSPATNFGWVLIGSESGDGTAKRFNSRHHPELATRPALTITYSVIPEPASVVLVGGLLTAGWGLLRRRGLRN